MSLIPERLAAGKIVRTMHFTTVASPKLVEIAGLSGKLHGIWIDQEHAGIHHGDLEIMLIACRAAGIDAFARVPYNDYSTIMRPMEAGCCGPLSGRRQPIIKGRHLLPAGVAGVSDCCLLVAA